MAGKASDKGKSIAVKLVGGKPLACKLREDGSLVVIGPDGRKAKFTAEQVRAAAQTEDSRPKKTKRGAAK
jgi:hypothetical protein